MKFASDFDEVIKQIIIDAPDPDSAKKLARKYENESIEKGDKAYHWEQW